jgi:uncharacterized protein (TIGR00369 family)
MTAAVSTFFATDEFDADTFDPLAHGFRHYGAFGFENFMGPFYVREADEGFELLVKVEDRHTNALDAAHGGFMLAVADIFLSATCFLHLKGKQHFVTVNLAHEFFGPAPRGSWVRGHGRLRKEGKSLMFPECEFFIGDELIGLARCVMKKLKMATPTDPDA